MFNLKIILDNQYSNMKTHDVFNQAPGLDGHNLFLLDRPLHEMIANHFGESEIGEIIEYGRLMGTSEWIEKGHISNLNSPVFRSHDKTGNRIDKIDFHPTYHELMEVAISNQLHCLPWRNPKGYEHVKRMAMYYLHAQNEAGTGCPLTMTFSCIPAIKNHLPQAKEWLDKILSPNYDSSNKPYFEKDCLTIGMAMTEKQGGTDVRANTSFAKPINNGGSGALYSIVGHKWFCSAPMCDAFLTLAQTDKGLSCFLLPRWRPDGIKNNFKIQRLKDKLGNRSNASSEIEFEGAQAWLMGEEGRGVNVIIEMVGLTRYDCMIGSAALLRRGVTEMINHISHREVMGKKLIDHELMKNVASDLCLESEAALAMTYRASLCLSRPDNQKEQQLLRLLLPIGKYWITKRAEVGLAEAMECLGGNGYVEESIMPRLYREAPVNAIWEGSGNVQCLDVIRAISRSPDILNVFFDELETASGLFDPYDVYLEKLRIDVPLLLKEESQARNLTGNMALCMQAAQLLKLENREIAENFCKSRFREGGGWLFGMLPNDINYESILKRYRF